MKTSLLTIISLFSLSVFAQEIQGTLMLKGSLKTKITVNNVNTTCKVKVKKVRNILEEDAYGNPGYRARIQLSLSGNDYERQIKVKFDKEVDVINMHDENGTKIVKDFDYFSSEDKIYVSIDGKGRLKQARFPYQGQTITCKF